MLSWLKTSPKSSKDEQSVVARDIDALKSAVPAASNNANNSTHLKGTTSAKSASTPTSHPSADKSSLVPSTWQPKRDALAAAQTYSRSATITELRGPRSDQESSRIAQALSAPLQSVDTLPTAPSEAPGSVVPELDKLFDPLTGAALGTFTMPQLANGQAREELWAHLARIRSLQAEIAGLHVSMEGIGLNEKAMHLRVRGARTRTRSGNAGERLDIGGSEREFDAEEREEADREEMRLREERDREFATAENRFVGRKEGIDKIMGKLGELSQALSIFHALETPVADFGTSRTNTHSDPASPTSDRSISPPLPSATRQNGQEILNLASDNLFAENPSNGIFVDFPHLRSPTEERPSQFRR